MKHRHLLCVLLALMILCGCLSSCHSQLPSISLDALLCYPGLDWNTTPEEVKTALQLPENTCIPLQDTDTQYTFSIQDTDVFGRAADVVFSFIKESGDNFGLNYVYVLYPDGTDMEAIQENLSDQLGQPLSPPNRTDDGHTLYWDSSDSLGSYISAVDPDSAPATENPAARLFWTDDAGLYFECYGQSEPAWRESYPAANMVVFEGFLTPWLQYAVSKLDFLNFPGLDWGMTPEEVCTALNLPEGSYVEQAPEEDGDTYFFLRDAYLEVFGANACVGFQFSDDNADGEFSLCRIVAVYPQDADMQSVWSAMEDAYGVPTDQMEPHYADWSSAALCQEYMTDKDKEYLSAQGAAGEEPMRSPLSTVQLTTYYQFSASYKEEPSTNVVTFQSSYAFYVNEGGYTGE